MSRLKSYVSLARVNHPIGSLLLMWPTLWALWLSTKGHPQWNIVVIFILGVFSMRSAGCVINDYVDRRVDGYVDRTKNRPLPLRLVTEKEALLLSVMLLIFSFLLVMLTNTRTIILSTIGLALAILYPFMKSYTHLPQLFLGLAFSWSIPMAYSAQGADLFDAKLWALFVANCLWTISYDTYYAMTDRTDDLNIGIKSTAILFGKYDLLIIVSLQVATLLLLTCVGLLANLNWTYFASILVAIIIFYSQFDKAKKRESQACFSAFLDNNRIGYCIFIGLALSYLL